MLKLMGTMLTIGFGTYLAGWYFVMKTTAAVAANQAAYYDTLLKIAGGN